MLLITTSHTCNYVPGEIGIVSLILVTGTASPRPPQRGLAAVALAEGGEGGQWGGRSRWVMACGVRGGIYTTMTWGIRGFQM